MAGSVAKGATTKKSGVQVAKADSVAKADITNKTRKSGRYKPGARHGRRENRLSKSKEAALRAELAEAISMICELRAQVRHLMDEVVTERNLRLSYEADAWASRHPRRRPY